MNKNELFFCAFFTLYSITGFAGVNCEQCGHEYEGESCPYEEQHRLLSDQLEALIGSENESTSEARSMISGDRFNHFYLDLGSGSLLMVKYLPGENPFMLFNAPSTPPHELRQQCNNLRDEANKYFPGSWEWKSIWQQAYEFTLEHSYNVHCLFFGVQALTRLQRFNEALALLERIRNEPISQTDAKFIECINKQEAFIYCCIKNYGHN
ncbi:hypothetical protein [Endozoicomonas euniceicola]|uniref:Tetratricopeptide repeat protein n=1 Tax=Endozoicomonas euniceicola TaxID=1234143 RepID=A0ABY6GRH1_9GAMM|nr:hypothetical protein [Endozoicomonas euniceicola]UYM14656.1 hypothetical protein NX720_17405 [Endozoicomonas euniceicola]